MEKSFIIPIEADLNIVEAKYKKATTFNVSGLEWKNTIEDLYEGSGRLRIRTKENILTNKSKTKISSEIVLHKSPLIAEDNIISMKMDFKPADNEGEEKIKNIKELIYTEGYNLYRKVEARLVDEGIPESWLYVVFKQEENFPFDYYDNSYYNIRNKGSIFLKEHSYLYKEIVRENLEVEIERECRKDIYKPDNCDINFENHIIDIYDKSRRFRIRNKNGELRYSIKVPLMSKDEGDIKTCIRIEFKPATEKGKELLNKALESLEREEEIVILEKWGGKYTEDGKVFWVNRDKDDNWWLEGDVEGNNRPVFPELFKLKENTRRSSVDVGKTEIKKDYYSCLKDRLINNLTRTSRTVKTGKTDVSVSRDKKPLKVNKDEVNLYILKALDYLISIKDDAGSPEKIKEIIEKTASIVTGRETDGRPFYRSHEVPYGRRIKAEQLEGAMDNFYGELSEKLKSNISPVTIASWAEKELDNQIHPYEDGCGRISKLVAVFILMKHGERLPLYPSREVYYSAMEGRILKEDREDRRDIVKKYLDGNPGLYKALQGVPEDRQFDVCYKYWCSSCFNVKVL